MKILRLLVMEAGRGDGGNPKTILTFPVVSPEINIQVQRGYAAK